jgi:prepilin-type N-terminal cleavage/methylation domain-containing protein
VRSSRPGFTLIELLIVLAMAAVLMAIGMPLLLNVAARYKVRSSAQQLEMLARQARYESIKLGQPVSVVPDVANRNFYVYSGTISGMPPFNGKLPSFPNGPIDLPALQKVAVWEVPRGVRFASDTAIPTYPDPVPFTFNPDGSGGGGPVTFCTPNQQAVTTSMSSQATGKLQIQLVPQPPPLC